MLCTQNYWVILALMNQVPINLYLKQMSCDQLWSRRLVNIKLTCIHQVGIGHLVAFWSGFIWAILNKAGSVRQKAVSFSKNNNFNRLLVFVFCLVQRQERQFYTQFSMNSYLFFQAIFNLDQIGLGNTVGSVLILNYFQQTVQFVQT